MVSDFIMSFMWVWSSVLIKMFVHTILGYGAHDLKGDILKHAISVINMFFFAFLVKATKGGAYNPLTILSGAISGDLTNFIFTVAARIPAQVCFLHFLSFFSLSKQLTCPSIEFLQVSLLQVKFEILN